jgi:hypothetical protein
VSERLLELAERCENVSGPEYGLEFDIALALRRDAHPPKPYTASLDAAMTLVPEGLGWVAGYGRCSADEKLSAAMIAPSALHPFDPVQEPIAVAEAASPALALCAAALRAREA